MKKQQKKNIKPRVSSLFRFMTWGNCFGTITDCKILKSKKETSFQITISATPETNPYVCDDLENESDIYRDEMIVKLEKKYAPREERLIQAYLLNAECTFSVGVVSDDDDTIEDKYTVLVQPLVSALPLIEIVYPAKELVCKVG